MTLGELGEPGAVRRVSIALTRGEEPQYVLAADEQVLTRAVILELVAKTSPASLPRTTVERLRQDLLDERWGEAILTWMDATGHVLDAYPDEPVWSERQLDEERMLLELRLSPLFQDPAE